jgi:hypothetical protein
LLLLLLQELDLLLDGQLLHCEERPASAFHPPRAHRDPKKA